MFEIDFYRLSEQHIIQMAGQKLRTNMDDWEKQIWQFILQWFDNSIASIPVFTSGSTGKPKRIEHTRSAMMNSALLTCEALKLEPGNNALLCLPVGKIGGMMMIVRSVVNKMNLVCIKPSSTPLSHMPAQPHIDFAAFTPMQFHEITSNYSVFRKAETITKVILGGEDVRAELLANIRKLNNDVYVTFGMTETISHIALKRLTGKEPDRNFKVLEGIKVSVNAKDCLVIEAPALGQPRLETNDLVRLVAENEFKWLGRTDHVINSGGVKIYPEEIEQQLAEFIEAPFFVTSVPDALSGERLALALEMTILTPLEEDELKAAFNSLEKLHRPKEIFFIPHFSRTENGKIKRKESLLLIERRAAF